MWSDVPGARLGSGSKPVKQSLAAETDSDRGAVSCISTTQQQHSLLLNSLPGWSRWAAAQCPMLCS